MRIAGITKGWIPDLGKLNCWIYIDMRRIPFSALLHLTPPPSPRYYRYEVVRNVSPSGVVADGGA